MRQTVFEERALWQFKRSKKTQVTGFDRRGGKQECCQKVYLEGLVVLFCIGFWDIFWFLKGCQ